MQVPAGRKIFVSGLIHLQNSGQYSCQRDYFQYYWGWPVGAKYERRCGRMNIRKTSKREIAAIRFRSNSHRNFPGFRLAVTMV